jgi:hypothetical protein
MRRVIGVVVYSIFVSTVTEHEHSQIIIVVCEMAWNTFVKYAYFCGVWLPVLFRRVRTIAKSEY